MKSQHFIRLVNQALTQEPSKMKTGNGSTHKRTMLNQLPIKDQSTRDSQGSRELRSHLSEQIWPMSLLRKIQTIETSPSNDRVILIGKSNEEPKALLFISGPFDSYKGPAIVRVILAVTMLFMTPLDCYETLSNRKVKWHAEKGWVT